MELVIGNIRVFVLRIALNTVRYIKFIFMTSYINIVFATKGFL